MYEFKQYCGASCFFDDPRLNNGNIIHSLHSWGLIIQQYKQFDSQTKKLLFIEGLAFMTPCTAVEPTQDMTCSGRDVSRWKNWQNLKIAYSIKYDYYDYKTIRLYATIGMTYEQKVLHYQMLLQENCLFDVAGFDEEITLG